PSARDLQQALQIQQVRRQLMDYVQKRVTVYLPKAVIAIEKPEIDRGDVERGDIVHFTFKVKNTGDAPLEIFAKPNCGCTVANFDKVVAPGAEGKIEAELNTATFRGRI